MSHFTTIYTEIRDLECARSALANMGLDMVDEGMCRFYGGAELKENVVRLPGMYDCALEKSITGNYNITADFWNGYVARYIGHNGSVIMSNYAIEMLKKMAKKMHLSMSKQEGGSYKVRDPKDSSGGFMMVSVDENGEVKFVPKGLKGKKCAKYFELEEALGKVASREFTKEYLQESKTKSKITDSRAKVREGGY